MKGPDIKSVKKVTTRKIRVEFERLRPETFSYECEANENVVSIDWYVAYAIVTLCTAELVPAINLNPPTKGYEWTGLRLWPGAHSSLQIHLSAAQTYRVKIMEDGMFTIQPELSDVS